ncbi:MAG: TolC family protein [Proteobacteria bacterium]|nr:TolC family protein [Pseudomonadota bacterium]
MLGLPATAKAQTVSIDEACRRAASGHEDVRIARQGVVSARSAVSKATSRMLPSLTAEGSFTRYSEQQSAGDTLLQPDDSASVSVRISQTLFSGGSKLSARRGAKLGVERSRRQLDGTREAVLLSTTRAYYNALKATRDLELKAAAVKRAGERKRVASARFSVGEVVKSAVLRAEAEVAGAEAEFIKAKSTMKDTNNRLKRIIGVTGELELVEPEIGSAVNEGVDELIKLALKRRLDYKESLLYRGIASEGVKEVRGTFLPTLKLEGVYNWYDKDPKTTFFQEESLSASLVLSYPLFEGGLRRAEMKEARSKVRVAELEVIAATHDIELEVREAYNRMESAVAVIEAYRRQLSFAEEDYKMVFEQFKFGLATTVDVIDSDTELLGAERSLMNSTYDMQMAILELKYAVGTLLDDYK